MSTYPTPGTLYKHFKNGVHEVLGTGVEQDSQAERVVCRSVEDGSIRLFSPRQFGQEVTVKAGDATATVPRFARIDADPADPLAAVNEGLKRVGTFPAPAE